MLYLANRRVCLGDIAGDCARNFQQVSFSRGFPDHFGHRVVGVGDLCGNCACCGVARRLCISGIAVEFDAWEEANGEIIPLESYEIGSLGSKCLSGIDSLRGRCGDAGRVCGARDRRSIRYPRLVECVFRSVIVGTLLGLLIGDNMLPPIVDTVYGKVAYVCFHGGLRISCLPWLGCDDWGRDVPISLFSRSGVCVPSADQEEKEMP